MGASGELGAAYGQIQGAGAQIATLNPDNRTGVPRTYITLI